MVDNQTEAGTYTRLIAFLKKYGSWMFVLIVGPILVFLTWYFKLSTAPISPILPFFVLVLFLSPWEAGVGFLIAVSFSTYTSATRPGEPASDTAIRVLLLLFFFCLIVYVKRRLLAISSSREILIKEEAEAKLFKALVDASPFAIMVEDKNSYIIMVNRELLRLTGYTTSEELIGRHVGILVPEYLKLERGKQHADSIKLAQQGQQTYHHNQAILRKDGSEVLVDLYTNPVPWKNEIALRNTLQDMTQVNELERERVRKKEDLEVIIKNNPLLTLLSSKDGTIIYSNMRMTTLFGYSLEEIIEKNLNVLIPEEHREDHERGRLAYWEEEQKKFDKGEPTTPKLIRTTDLYGLHKNGTVFKCDIALSWVVWEGKLTSLAVIRDLTDKEKLEQETARANLAENTVKIRDKFLSLAAHELKTPIASIVLYADLLETYYQDTLQTILDHRVDFETKKQLTTKAIKAIQKQALTISLLINQFLDISLIKEFDFISIHREHISTCELLKELIDLSQLQTTKHAITLSCPEEMDGYVDRLRLEQIMVNLLNNAIKYSPYGGDIIVTAKELPGHAVQISVRDHGIGIPPDTRAQIFTRFFRAHPEISSGLGLGLYLSKEIIKAHKGSITFTDPDDGKGGTVFTITFPPEHESINSRAEMQRVLKEDGYTPGKPNSLLDES